MALARWKRKLIKWLDRTSPFQQKTNLRRDQTFLFSFFYLFFFWRGRGAFFFVFFCSLVLIYFIMLDSQVRGAPKSHENSCNCIRAWRILVKLRQILNLALMCI